MTPAISTESDAALDLVTIGEVGRTHGLAGELKVRPIADTPDRLDGLEQLILEAEDGRVGTFTIQGVRHQGQWLIVSFHEISSVEQAQPWVRSMVKIPMDRLENLPEGEYYHFDLIGMEVVTETGARLGAIEDIIPTGSNDVFVVRHENEEYLIPSTEEVVRQVDVAQKRMVIRPMEGLLDCNAV